MAHSAYIASASRTAGTTSLQANHTANIAFSSGMSAETFTAVKNQVRLLASSTVTSNIAAVSSYMDAPFLAVHLQRNGSDPSPQRDAEGM